MLASEKKMQIVWKYSNILLSFIILICKECSIQNQRITDLNQGKEKCYKSVKPTEKSLTKIGGVIYYSTCLKTFQEKPSS